MSVHMQEAPKCIWITKHAKARLHARCNKTGKKAGQMAQRAFERGISHADAKGNLKSHLAFIWGKYKRARNLRVFAGKVFVFCDITLVTVLDLPVDLVADYEAAQHKKNIVLTQDTMIGQAA